MQRTILAYTLNPTSSNNEQIGLIKPLAEIVDNKLVELNRNNFCPSMEVLITSYYSRLELKYPDRKIFEITVSENPQENRCKYFAKEVDARKIEPKAYFEIIKADLPEANNRIINLNNFPGTTYIFVNNGEILYGPLAWDKEGDDRICLKIITTPLPGFAEMYGQIYKIGLNSTKNHNVVAHSSDGDRYLISGLSIIKDASLYDYASDNEVVSYCAKQTDHVTGLKKVTETLKELAGTLQASQISLVQQRLAKLTKIADLTDDYQDKMVKGVSVYLQSENGKKTIENYLEKYESSILVEFKKKHQGALESELTLKKGKIDEAEARIKELDDRKAELSQEVQKQQQELQRSREEAQKPNKEVASAEIAAYLHEGNKELDELKKEIETHKDLAEGLVTIKNLKTTAEHIKWNIKQEESTQQTLKETTKQLRSELDAEDDALRKKLTGLKPFIEAINGSFISEEDETRKIYVNVNSSSSEVGQREVIKAIQQVFVSHGRELDDWQVVNLLICTQQSFITFLAGLPGVAKTSSARLLAEIQNLKPRIQEISVARGWTTQKELIGFYNPLSGRFQASNTGLYGFLNALSGEENGQSTAMSYALLDEANLSPIEHYWSAFMAMTDGEVERELILGRDKLKIPANLRFIATINYDGTTEPLSDRVVDRAPIIVLESKELAKPIKTDGPSLLLPISALKMNELFGNDQIPPLFEYAEQSVFNDIRDTLSGTDSVPGRPIIISPRKEKAIRQFCGKARGIMNEDSDYFALDIAVLQHILPLIRGNGSPFSKRLEMLKDKLEISGLKHSAKYLSRMIAYGKDDLHTYDFFCW